MQRKKLILFHLVFWLIVFIKNEIIALTAGGLSLKLRSVFFFSKSFVISVGYLSISMLAFYGSYIIVTKIVRQKKIVPAILYIGILLFSLVAYRAFLEFCVFKPFLQYDNYPNNNTSLWKYFIPNVVFYYWDFIIYGMAWAIFRHWQSVERSKQEQENLDKTAQLTFLQSQINPHFLFNTINDIYALSLKKSDKTPGALMQLSGLLRYALYDTKELLVPLQKELTYIQDYLELQRTGYDNFFYVGIKTDGDPSAWNILPMLLLPFVENACKHGVTNDPEHPVTISLQAENKKLVFIVRNKIRIAEKDAEGGIGIENIRKRLELLYPSKHRLHIKQDNDIFIVELEIDK